MVNKARLVGFALLLLVLLGIAWWAVHASGRGADTDRGGTRSALAQPSSMPQSPPQPADPAAGADEPRSPVERSALASAPPASRGSLLVHVVWGDDQSPAQGILLTLHSSGADELFELPAATSDAQGDARFAELAPGRVYVQTERGEGQWGEMIPILAGEEARQELTLEFGMNCKGLVVDAHEQPVADAEVLAAGWAGGVAQVLARSGPDGRFALRCIATHCHIGARKPGYEASRMRQFTAGKHAEVEFTIVLEASSAELEGLVLDPQHQPLAGSIVQAGIERGGIEKLADGGLAKAAMPARATSDAQGRFAFRSLAPGELPVHVRARGLAPWHGSVQLERGRAAQLVVQLEPGVTLSGTVRDAAGAPVAGATLNVGDWDDLSHRSAPSDAAGQYRLDGLSTGALELHAEADGKGKADTTLEARAGQTLRWDPLLSNGLVLKGRVLDADGKPVERAMVEGQLEQWKQGDRWWGMANTDKEGRFSFEGCIPGRPIRVSVRRKSTFPELTLSDVLPGPDECLIRLPKEAWVTIRGRILGPDESPLANVHVSPLMSGAGGSPAETASPETGEFGYGPYPPGEYRLKLQADGFAPIRLGPRVLGPDEVWDVGTLHFQKGGSLRIHLTRADGKPPGEHCGFDLLDADGAWLEQIDVQEGTGLAGPFATGSYLLQIRGAELACRQQQVDVQAGVELRVDVLAQAGLPAEIECRLPAEHDARGGVQIVVRDSSGVAVFRGLAWGGEGPPTLALCLSRGTYSVDARQGALHGSAALSVEPDSGTSRITVGLVP